MTRIIIVISLIITMVLIPYSVHGNAPVFIWLVGLFYIFTFFLKIPGAEFLLIAIALCIPSGWVGISDLVFPEVDKMKGAFSGFVSYLMPLMGFYLLLIEKKLRNTKIPYLIMGILFVGFVSLLLTYETKDIHMIISLFGCSYAFMFVCYNDRKIDIKDVFLYMDVLFSISFVYGILEYFFRQSPYQFVTDSITTVTMIPRARGILGHPLYLSGLALFYQSIIFIRFLLLKKFGYIQEILCVAMALIVVSRTTIIVMLLEYMLFIILTKGYKSLRFWMANLLFIFAFFIFLLKYADSIVIDIATRFIESNVGNRDTAMGTVFLLFLDNPFGVGFQNIMDSIAKGGYGVVGFDDEFSTVDNLFLSQLAAYGIFSIFKILYYFYFLIDAYKSRNKYPMLYKTILFLYFPFIFESFSFDWDTSIFLCFLLYGFIGFMYRHSIKTERISLRRQFLINASFN